MAERQQHNEETTRTLPQPSGHAPEVAAQLPPELAELSQEELAFAARAVQKNKEWKARAGERKRANAAAVGDRIEKIEKALDVLAQPKKDHTPTEEKP